MGSKIAGLPTSPLIFRKGLDLKDAVAGVLAESYHSDLVTRIKAADYRYTSGRLTLHLAREFGFCYGVDRAVDYAYETRTKFPDRRILLVGEIIHNPHVNQRLREMGIEFLFRGPDGQFDFSSVSMNEVILLPAFGVAAFGILLPLTMVILVVLAIVTLSYRDVVSVYTKTGGSYVVARENFGPAVAQVAAVALMLDYIVTVAVQSAAGTLAVTSAFPALAGANMIITVGITTIVWLATTFLTRPEPQDTLVAFYARTRPSAAGWAPIARLRPDFLPGKGAKPSGPPMTKAKSLVPTSRRLPSISAKSSDVMPLPRASC